MERLPDPVFETKEQTWKRRQAESQQMAIEASNLADRGLFRCSGKCKRVIPLQSGTVVIRGGTVMLGICDDCLVQPVVIKQVETPQGRAVFVGMAGPDRPAAPPSILLASNMNAVDRFAGQAGLAKKERMTEFDPMDGGGK